jgi:hypothetical protein
MLYRAKYCCLAEIIVPANSKANKNFNFVFQQQLQTIMGNQTVTIEAMETYSDSHITFSPITTSNPVATAPDILNATLTLQFGTFQGVSQLPLASICRQIPYANAAAQTTPGVYQLMMFREMFKIDWTKSYITLVADAPTTTQFSYLFNMFYDYLPVM